MSGRFIFPVKWMKWLRSIWYLIPAQMRFFFSSSEYLLGNQSRWKNHDYQIVNLNWSCEKHSECSNLPRSYITNLGEKSEAFLINWTTFSGAAQVISIIIIIFSQLTFLSVKIDAKTFRPRWGLTWIKMIWSKVTHWDFET